MKFERITIIAIIIITIIIINTPLILLSNHDDNRYYLGRTPLTLDEMYPVISAIQQAKEGNFFIHNLYTSEQEDKKTIQPLNFLTGTLAAKFNLQAIDAYHSVRSLLSAALIIAIYIFISKIFSTVKERLICLGIILFSSGIGLLIPRLNSIDLWLPEATTFSILSFTPQIILGHLLLLVGLNAFSKYTATPYQKKYALLSSIAFSWLAFELPFSFIGIIPVLCFLAFQLKSRRRAVVAILSQCIGLGIYLALIPMLSLAVPKTTPFVVAMPGPILILTGFGFLVPLAVVGLEMWPKSKILYRNILAVWFFALLCQLYVPGVIRTERFIGIHMILSIFTTYGLLYLLHKLESRYGVNTRIIVIASIVFLSMTSGYTLLMDIRKSKIDREVTIPYFFLTQQEKDGLTWLGENSSLTDVVLANWKYSNIIPGLLGTRVYLGHKSLTNNYSDKAKKFSNILQKASLVEELKFFEQYHITYVFLNRKDDMVAHGFKNDERPFMQKKFANDEIIIYQVKHPSN